MYHTSEKWFSRALIGQLRSDKRVQTNSAYQYGRKCIEKKAENMHADL